MASQKHIKVERSSFSSITDEPNGEGAHAPKSTVTAHAPPPSDNSTDTLGADGTFYSINSNTVCGGIEQSQDVQANAPNMYASFDNADEVKANAPNVYASFDNTTVEPTMEDDNFMQPDPNQPVRCARFWTAFCT
jgi:hypothetical protein